MTFEKALEAMRQGKVVERKEWDGKCRICMYHNAIYAYPFLRDFPNLRTFDITANDWQIYEQKTIFNSVVPVYNCRCEINPEEIERLKKTLSENTRIGFEPCEENAMEHANKIEITFKSGDTITYSKGEWDDYSYDGKAVTVKKDGAWIGIYNFDNVFCVELKQ